MDSDDEKETLTSINVTEKASLISEVRIQRKTERRLICCFCFNMWIRMIIGLVLFTLVGGIVYGFNGLKEVMIDVKMFSSFCAPNVTLPCADQLYYLNSIFQTTAAGINVFSFLVGFLTDILPQTAIFFIAFVLTTVPLGIEGVLIRFRLFDRHFWWLSHAMFFLMGNGGGLMMFAFFKWIFMIPPGHKTLAWFADIIASLFTAAWDLSAVMFYLFNILYFKGVDILIPFEVTAGVVFIGCFLFMFILRVPKRWTPAPNLPPSLQHDPEAGTPPSKWEILRTSLFGLFRYALSWRMFILYIWMATGALQFYFLLSTVYDQALWLTGSTQKADQYNNVFSVLLPFVGFIFSGILGFFVNRLNVAIVGLVALNLTYTVLSCIPIASPYLQFPFYCLLVIGRIYTFVVLTKTIRHYFCKENPMYFGRLISLVLTVGGLVALLSTPLNILTSAFHGSFFQVNIIVGAIALVGNLVLLIIPLSEAIFWCRDRVKRSKKKKKGSSNGEVVVVKEEETPLLKGMCSPSGRRGGEGGDEDIDGILEIEHPEDYATPFDESTPK